MLSATWRADLEKILFTYAIPFAGKLLGAILLWIIGRLIIGGIRRMVRRALEYRKLDPTLVTYADSAVGVTLTVLLVLSILSIFGVETTTFAGVLAAAGVALGMAWSGLLSNFAAGVFMVILRPFKVGDFVTAGGVTGTVREIGLFATAFDTPDNIRTIVGNAKIFGDTIQNFNTNAYRRVELKAQIAGSVDPADAKKRLLDRLAKIPHVIKDPPPFVDIVEFTGVGPVLAVRPFCHNDHYWDVYFDTQRAIQEEFAAAGYPTPEQAFVIRKVA